MKALQTLFWNMDRKALFWNSVLLWFFKIISLPLWLTFSLLVAKLYWSEAMGIFWIVISIIAIASTLWNLWIETAMPRLVKTDPWNIQNNSQKTIWTSTVIVTSISLLLWSFLFFFSEFISLYVFSDPSLILPIALSGLSLPLLVNAKIYWAYLLGVKRIKASEIIYKVIVPLVALVILLGSYYYSNTLYVPVWAFLISQMLWWILWIIVIFWKQSNINIPSSKEIKKIVKITWPLAIASIAWIVVMWTDTLMLWYFWTTQEVWVYTLVFKLAALIMLPFHIAIPWLGPQIVELFRNKKNKRLKDLVTFSTKLFFMIWMVVFFILCMFSPKILSIFWSEFIIWSTTLKIVSCMYITTLFFALNWFIASNCWMEKISKNISLLAAGLNILLNLILIPRCWILWAAIASLISFTCSNIFLSYYIHKDLNIKTRIYFRKNSHA